MGAVERLIQRAEAEEGYLEKATNAQLDDPTANAGDGNWTKYARDLDNLGVYNTQKNGYAWCDVFVDWCFIQCFGLETAMAMTGQVKGGYGAGCTSSKGYYEKMRRFTTSGPKAGDQIFFADKSGKKMAHTGIVRKVENGKVYTVEGNTSSKAGVVANGGCVRAKSYSLTYNRIAGYGHPDYSLVKEEDEVTQEQWDEMMTNWLNRKAEEDPADWSLEHREWAENNGLIAGDANGKKMYRSFCTREQMMVFLHRMAEKFGLG